MKDIVDNDGDGILVKGSNSFELSTEEAEALVARCVAQAMNWRLPPKWTRQEWREELYSQAHLTLMEAAPQYDESLGVPFTAFLWHKIIADLLNRYRQEWRYAYKCPVSLQDATNGLIKGEIDLNHICDSADIECAIALLTFEDRQLLQKIFWEGCTETEIARILKISQRAVNKRKKRALKALANLLEVPDFSN